MATTTSIPQFFVTKWPSLAKGVINFKTGSALSVPYIITESLPGQLLKTRTHLALALLWTTANNGTPWKTLRNPQTREIQKSRAGFRGRFNTGRERGALKKENSGQTEGCQICVDNIELDGMERYELEVRRKYAKTIGAEFH
jgi:hypothetical protein